MPSPWTVATGFSSTSLRICAYCFFRWIPGHHFPPLVYGLAVVYASSFAKQLSRQFGESTSARGKEKKNETRDSPSSSPYNLRSKDKDEVDTSGDGEDADESAQGPNVAQVLLLGLPSPRYLVWSAVTVAVNLLLVLGVVDYIYRGPQWHPSHDVSFARVGYVSPNAAKILVREPDLSQLPIYLSYRKGSGSTDDAWKAGGKINVLSEDTDFTQALTISRLSAETQYQYTLSTNHSGHFKTAPSAGRSPAKEDGGKFTFLTSSCIKPNFPYNPISHPLSIPGFRHLGARLPELGAHFMLFLGDFIYIDVPKRLGVDVETYRREYRMVYNSPDWPSVSEDLPWLHVLDDHEIQNDWDGNTTGVYQAAADPWIHYHTSVNPPAVRPGASYFSFAQGPASFFMMDTRRYRSPEFAAPNDAASKTMLGKQQLDDLLLWLRKPEPEGVKWKIIASSIPFTKNWRFGDSDTWAGYLSERQCVLEAMWDVGLRGGVGVVVISGDRHEFAATSFPPPPGKKWPLSATVHEFSTSPLSQFYLPVRTYRQEDDEDVTIKYIPDGNSKFGAIEITSPEASDQSLLKFRLFVNGKETWSHVLTSPPSGAGAGRGKDALWS